MSTMWKLYKGDLRSLTSNIASIIITIGLVAFPGLFAWFNIAASWDPFGNTNNLKFAVANIDEGYQSDLIPLKINVGEQVISSLRSNDQLNWTFTSEEDAIEGTKSGEYYAAVVIPKDFSTTMMTFFSNEGQQANLAYYTNEKLNAVAPKVTGQGAEGISVQINQVFASTLTNVALSIANQISTQLDKPQSQQMLSNFSTNISEFANQLTSTASTLNSYGALTGAAQSLLSSANALMSTTSTSAGNARDQIQQASGSVSDIASALDTSASTLADALTTSSNSYASVADNIDSVFSNVNASASDVSSGLRKQASLVNDQIAPYQQIRENAASLLGQDSAVVTALDSVITRITSLRDSLNAAADKVDQDNSTAQSQHQRVKALATQAKSEIASVQTDFADTLKPQISQITSDINGLQTSVGSLSGDISSSLAGLQNTVDQANDSLNNVQQTLSTMSNLLNDTGKRLADFNTQLSNALNSGDMQEVRKVLGNDPDTLATTLAAPVSLNRTVEFPIENFGASMTPFYTFIPLWVGSLLMLIALKVSVSRKTRKELGNPKPHQLFLGHYGIFATIALLQSTFSCAGTLLFLRIHMVHPWLFMLAGWVSSLVFSLLTYTAVASFGNVGKAFGMVFLILQISGAGGSYPLQLLPSFIRDLSPYLPMTHSILAARAAIAGIYMNDYWYQLGLLLLFVPPALILGLFLRKPLMRFNKAYVERVERTKLLA